MLQVSGAGIANLGQENGYIKWCLQFIKKSKKNRGRQSKCHQDQAFSANRMQWEDDISIDIGEDILEVPEDNDTIHPVPGQGQEDCWPEPDQLQEAINTLNTGVM